MRIISSFISTPSAAQLPPVGSANEIGKDLIKTHKQGVGEVFIDLSYGSSLYKSRTIGKLTTLSISEGFIRSSDEVLTAVLQSVLVGKTEASNQIIRQFGMSEECSDVLLEPTFRTSILRRFKYTANMPILIGILAMCNKSILYLLHKALV